MINLTVVRHGESLGNFKGAIDNNSSPKTDVNGLSEKGKLQAIEVAKKLNGRKFDLVLVSQLKRTIETLAPYLKNKDIEIVYSNLTNERNAGDFAGKPKNAMKEYCQTNNITDLVNFKPKNGESIAEVYQRAKEFLEYISKRFQNKSILLCGHVNFLGCLDIAINHRDINSFYLSESLKNGEIKEYILK